ncbi:hypothetical protein SAMN05444411_101868 [Lutibacter oricola]|uniref:Uncharacterized protein n=1 Tax=Lutibacter oricola TaxID=762486 RepID=A0A1H2U1U7_9FLAO|nr:hypothetical protein [Lutibacter oricola]SDW50146.1 hypothetical protein SAMN05444411_101868 [Lutibacter oricola]
MEFKRIRKRKKPNYKRGFILVLALFLILYLWFNAEDFIAGFLGK